MLAVHSGPPSGPLDPPDQGPPTGRLLTESLPWQSQQHKTQPIIPALPIASQLQRPTSVVLSTAHALSGTAQPATSFPGMPAPSSAAALPLNVNPRPLPPPRSVFAGEGPADRTAANPQVGNVAGANAWSAPSSSLAAQHAGQQIKTGPPGMSLQDNLRHASASDAPGATCIGQAKGMTRRISVGFAPRNEMEAQAAREKEVLEDLFVCALEDLRVSIPPQAKQRLVATSSNV